MREFQTSTTMAYEDLLELDIHFISNSAEIPENDHIGLDEMYISFSKSKYCRIELASNKNDVGNEESNLRLSQRYSDVVKAFLVYKEIYESQILAKGYGEKQPKTSNDTDLDKASFRWTKLRFIQ